MQYTLIRFLFPLAATSLICRPAFAQIERGGLASITGSVRDTGAFRYPRSFSVCTFIRVESSIYSARCSKVDTAGSYLIEKLPLNGFRFSVQCGTLRGLAKIVSSDSIVFTDTARVRHDWVVSSVGCDLRPVRKLTGVFSGHYTPGFESSRFVPCPADAWFIPSDSLDTYRYDARRAWATWRNAKNQELKWPDAPRDDYGNETYYVRWRGTVVGPGSYGHMGVSPFEFFVDSVITLRAPAKNDCR